MKTEICRKLAIGNIKKNYRFFIPRILAETGLLACFYIIFTLACDKRLSEVKGGSYLPTFMWMGAVIIGLLSAVLMLYTNSFLMRQRKREFGLYNVLGMEKKHVLRVLFHESLVSSVVSIAAGLLFGVLFYKLSSLAICKLLKAEIVAGFYFITPKTIVPSGLIFFGIDAFAYLVNCLSIGKLKPVELLNGDKTGEKEPKIKWVLLILGVLSLGGGYFISLTTKNPLEAILVFFAAVLLVIIGTYFLFTAGSIFVLKALKKNEKYYYRPGHVTAVSGLLYRMKQNAVGLASVAILSTGVLVMISSTFCLYSRTETVLKANYPQDFYLSTVFYDEHGVISKYPEDLLVKTVGECAEKNGLKVKEGFSQKYFDVTFSHKPGILITDRESVAQEQDLSGICNILFITEETYVRFGGNVLGLGKNEVAVCPYNVKAKFGDEYFTLSDEKYAVVKELSYFPIRSNLVTVNCFGMVVSDETFDEIYEIQKQAYGYNASEMQNRYCVVFENREKALEVGSRFTNDVYDTVYAYIEEKGQISYSVIADSFWEARENLYGMYGTLLFLGVLLGLVCLFATVLIIYYKQISEGYEDRQRYQIMQRIGMTEREVKNTIRSQILLVFFLPLLTAGIHVAFAYPIITKLMSVLLLDNAFMFAKWCVIVYVAFAAVYALIYKLTAKTYYKIVY